MTALTLADIRDAMKIRKVRTIGGTDIPTIDYDTRLEDLGIDSLDMIEIVFELEDIAGRAMPDDAEACETFGDLLRLANNELEEIE